MLHLKLARSGEAASADARMDDLERRVDLVEVILDEDLFETCHEKYCPEGQCPVPACDCNGCDELPKDEGWDLSVWILVLAWGAVVGWAAAVLLR